jgi:hypothetical protein
MGFAKAKCFEGTKDINFVSNNNNITKVCLGQIDEFNENYFVFMNRCRHVEYLEMTCTKDVNIEMVRRKEIYDRYSSFPFLVSLCDKLKP